MDLITLNSQYQQSKLIENYDSLIWTERFNTVGDFQLVTGNSEFLDILPEGTVLSLRESTVPMVVKRHLVERKKDLPAKYTIVGTEFTNILKQRQAIQSVVGALGEWKVVAKQPSDVAYFIIVKVCVEGICDVADIFPPDKVQFIAPADYLDPARPNRQFAVSRGNLMATVLSLLQTEAEAEPDTVPPSPAVVPHGIRAIRPNTLGTAIGIQIYTGVDRTATIRFEATRDMLNDGSYLFSSENYNNAAYVLGPEGALKLHKGDVVPSGLDRSVLLVDATTSGVTENETLKTEGTSALSKAKKIARFDGSINEDLSPYIFNRDYGLGDTVLTVGDYGLATPARVTEFIRSEDATGTKSYPTLVSIEEETS